ncbi:unnamed protein product [Phytomonas sp. Hart1]|nr:unnamed protein product [Phytomonas sp. Hart1]|eukprot:CCW72278.1 unnamed protein product [Phytomonas sp. isolate Hart1]
MQPVQPNNNLPGLGQNEVVILSEKLYHIANEGFMFCSQKCITHYGEDSIPYHPGEKACLDRCISKVRHGMYMAIDTKRKFEEQLKAQEMPYQWMRDAAAGKFGSQ